MKAVNRSVLPAEEEPGAFSSRELIIGDNVNATTADIVTAPTSVKANSVKRAPVNPP
jgi:hypothetical protein